MSLNHILGWRAYSSFLLKPRGGRYFNCSKPSKAVVPSKKIDSPVSEKTNLKGSALPSGHILKNGPIVNSSAGELESSLSSQSSKMNPIKTPEGTEPHPAFTFHQHLNLDAKYLGMHRKFSLHRLNHLLTQSSILESSVSIFFTKYFKKELLDDHPRSISMNLDGYSVTLNSEADAVRQLLRSSIINHASPAFAWEATLCCLGLGYYLEKYAKDGVYTLGPTNKESEEVVMDSTRRKRRKKMRKHKLKKRRRATRASRLKIGR